MNKTDEDFVFLKLTCMREAEKKLQLRTINTLHHMLERDTCFGKKKKKENVVRGFQVKRAGVVMSCTINATAQTM